MTATIPYPRRTGRPLEATPPPATGVIPVVCVDPYDLAQHGVAYLARRYPDLRLVGQVRSLAAAREVIARTRPAVVLLGDDLTDGGRALAGELRASHPRMGLVMVSHRTHDLLFPRARAAGMSAFVSRSAPVTALVAAIRHAAAAPTSFRTFGVPWAVERDANRVRELSEREHQVLALMGDGLSAEDIASVLEVGRGTVRTYVSRLYTKLNVTNRSQALVAAAGNPLVAAGRQAQPVGRPAPGTRTPVTR